MSHLALCSFLSIALFAQAQSPPPTSAELTALARQLSSDDFADRQEATDKLWRAGPAAKPVLEAVLKGGDFEAVARAKGILKKFRLGIWPSTPPEIVRLIERFPDVDENEQHEILAKLNRERRYGTLLALLRSVEDNARRQQLARRFTVPGPQVVAAMLDSGDRQMAQDQLCFTALSGDQYSRAARDYGAFLLLTDGLDAAIADLQQSLDPNDESSMRVLARLLQVHGKLDDAIALARKTKDRQLQSDLYYRAEDWAALAAIPPGDEGVERYGFAAAFHRLAGQQGEFEAAVAGLISVGKERDDAWMSAEALAVNDQWDAAIRLLGAYRVVSLRFFQLQPLQAFRELGLENPRHDAVSWFSIGGANIPDGPGDFFVGLTVVKALHELGEEDTAQKLLEIIEGSSQGADDWRLYNIIETNLKLERREQAWQLAVRALDNEKIAPAVLQLLFPARGVEAQQWWQTLRTLAPEQDRSVTLRRLERLLQSTPDSELPTLAKFSAEQAAKMEDKEAFRRLEAIAELCARQGQFALAGEYFAQQAKRMPTEIEGSPFVYEHPRVVVPLQRIGDMFAAEKEWLRAAQAYHEAWQCSKSNSVALYLHGYALVQAGQVDEGQQILSQAKLLPLADTEERNRLAEAMQQRGLELEAIAQWELILRLGAFERWEGSEDWAVSEAAQQLGDRAEAKNQPGHAAALWQRCLFYTLKTNASFQDLASYANIVNQIHRAKALDLLEQGKVDEAVREIELARAARPGDVELVEKTLPELMRAGCTKFADKLFDDVYQAYDQVCEDFRNSARHHNGLAWLAARCNRRLDDALAHAQRAVELRPDRAGYLDTLAEVHFRRGERSKAITAAKRSLDLEPQNAHLQQQLHRFENDE